MSVPSKLFGSKTAARPHLVRPGGGLSGEVHDLRQDVDAAFDELESGGGLFQTDEFTNVAAADPNGIVESFASSASEDVRSGAELDGAVGGAEMVPPRNITITSSTHADIDAVAVQIVGQVRDDQGELITQTDTITLTDGGNATDVGTKAFSLVTSITIPAQSGTGGALEVGFGAIIGLSKPIKTRAGLTAPLREVAGGSVVTNGTFTTAAAQGPHGTYAPNSAPNGTLDYAVTYEVDPAL